METILLTGADGLLGRYIVEYLHSFGYSVRVLLEDRSETEFLFKECEVFRADLANINDDERLEKAIKGCDYIIHAAAIVSIWAPKDLTWAVNDQGTERVLNIAEEMWSQANGIDRNRVNKKII